MSLLTESNLRFQLKGKDLDALKEFHVDEGTVITPAAREYLADNKIALIYGDGNKTAEKSPLRGTCLDPDSNKQGESNLPEFVKPKRYETITGAYYDEKPEHMTAIRGPKLVNKDHPIIRFRGKIDSFEARILEVQIAMQKLGLNSVVTDLGEILKYTQEILRCEVLGCDLDDQMLLGMSSDEIRSRSHTPKKYYGLNHFATSLEHGEAVILLNTLRTQVREVELTAYDTFKDEYGIPSRTDIIQGLNRLSSLFYVMMFKVLTKEY